LELIPELVARGGRLQAQELILSGQEFEQGVLVISVELDAQALAHGAVGHELLVDLRYSDRPIGGIGTALPKRFDQ
jgi:hypothetical protein